MATRSTNFYIAVAGIMGSGKTTASNILAEELGIPLIEEIPQENPFLEDFYKDMKRWAMHCEIFYILRKLEQNIQAKKILGRTHVVHDGPSGQDLIYTKTQKKLRHITPTEYKLLDSIFKLYKPQIIFPDPLIFLDASVDLIMKRISLRKRPYEKNVSRHYISTLHEFQKKWIKSYPEDKKIVIPADKMDLKGKRGRKIFVETVKTFIENKSRL